MRVSSILRTATVALTLVAAAGAASNAFAATRAQQQAVVNSGPYDSPDFVVPPTNIEP